MSFEFFCIARLGRRLWSNDTPCAVLSSSAIQQRFQIAFITMRPRVCTSTPPISHRHLYPSIFPSLSSPIYDSSCFLPIIWIPRKQSRSSGIDHSSESCLLSSTLSFNVIPDPTLLLYHPPNLPHPSLIPTTSTASTTFHPTLIPSLPPPSQKPQENPTTYHLRPKLTHFTHPFTFPIHHLPSSSMKTLLSNLPSPNPSHPSHFRPSLLLRT